MLTSLFAASLLAQAPLAADGSSRLLRSELSLGLGLFGQSYSYAGGRFGDLFMEGALEGRLVLSGFTADGSISAPMATGAGAAGTGFSATVRAGWTGQRWSVVAGLAGQYVGRAEPSAQWLPSMRATYAFERWRVSAGLFEYRARVPAHLTVEVGDYGLGYIAPLGALASWRLRVNEGVGLRISALAFRLFNSEVAMLTVAASTGPEWNTSGGAL